MRMRFYAGWLGIVLGLGMPGLAHAYLDPASGGLLLQVLLGGLAGAALFVRLFWRRLLGFFGIRRHPHDDSPG